jgi:hypothetical protein
MEVGMSLGNRLEELRGNISIVEFSQMFGIHKNTYSNYVKHQNAPDMKFVLAVCKKFRINLNWFLLGVGPKYLENNISTEAENFENKEYMLLPLIETWVIGKEGEIIHDGILEYVPIKRTWLEKAVPNLNEDRFRSFLVTRVRSDFMAPTINPGDLILLDTDRSYRNRPGEGDICLVRLPDGERSLQRVVVARVQGGCTIFMFPDNITHHQITQFSVRSEDELHYFILGRVLWLCRDFQ